jgi:hypothetical protein
MAPEKTDPTLLKQMKRRGGAASVSAVFRLRPRAAAELALPPGETEAAMRRVLDRVTGSVGTPPDGYRAFPSLGSFSVSAKPKFLRALLDQPEILSAMANRQDEDLRLKPVPAPRRARKPGAKAQKRVAR